MKKGMAVIGALAAALFLLSGCGETESEVPEAQQAQTVTEQEEVSGSDGQEKTDMASEETGKTEEIKDTEENEKTTDTKDTKENEEAKDTEKVEPPEPVKGIYVTGPMAGHAKMENLIQLVRDSELNAMVIDIKNDEGIVTYQMEEPMVQELEADVRYIADLPGLVQRLKAEDVYLIARIVAFKDPILASRRPDLCIQRKDGGVFVDKNGLAWVNPYQQEVWDYLLAVAKQAAAAGFDEIQFDYIRFPTEISDEEADYGETSLEKSKTDVITEFTAYAYENLSPLNVKVSADVFGTVIDNETDAEIVGQDYQAMAEHLDYICPMIYPSHYNDGVYGLAHPDLQPYETITGAMQASAERLAEIPEGTKKAEVRPWLQDFTATWLSAHQTYGPEQIRQQIQAVYDNGSTEWLLWNAKCSYTEGGLLTPEEAKAAEEAARAAREAAELEAEQEEAQAAAEAESSGETEGTEQSPAENAGASGTAGESGEVPSAPVQTEE